MNIEKKLNDDLDAQQKQHIQYLMLKLIVGIIFTVLLLLGSIAPTIPFLGNKWLQLFLATPVQFWVGWSFIIQMINDVKGRSAGMYTLIAFGTLAAYFYSVLIVLFPGLIARAGIPEYIYFEAAATIITLVLLGQVLETRAQGAASQAIRKLIGLQPQNATVAKEEAGERHWVEISIDDVVLDTRMLVKPGDKVPTDGIVVAGESHIDESMVTGESEPVFKKEGSPVIGGTINISGALEVRATKIGSETMLARIIQLVEQAQTSKMEVQRLVDKVSAIFVPVVIIVSLITFLIWFNMGPQPSFIYAFVAMIAVLIIACPCALGLATPTSVTVAVGRAAQFGALIKNAQMLETAGKVSIVVLDKTGTLTKAQREVTNCVFIKNLDEFAKQQGWKIPAPLDAFRYVLSLMLAVETRSRHPISDAVARYVKQGEHKDFEVAAFESLRGLGLRAVVDQHEIRIGSRQLVERETIVIPKELDQAAEQFMREAQTVSFMVIDNKVVAVFGIADVLREDAKKTIDQLKKLSIKTAIISGDNAAVVHAIADKLGIETRFAQVLPEEKEQYIAELRKQGNIVAMVGDGINDAPALAASDLGIAMGGGTEIAIESAGVALLHDDIALVPSVILLARATLRNIKQNLVWAFGYNILLVPVAMGILYPVFGILLSPIIAGAAMAFSSLSVVINALRLKRMKI